MPIGSLMYRCFPKIPLSGQEMADGMLSCAVRNSTRTACVFCCLLYPLLCLKLFTFCCGVLFLVVLCLLIFSRVVAARV